MPFPFVERPRLRPRPVLLVTDALPGTDDVAWALMITTAENAGWPDDVSLIERHREFGLPVPCVIRTAKIATVQVSDAPHFGRLSDDLLDAVRVKLQRLLSL